MHQMEYAASAVVEGHTERRTLDSPYAAGLRARPAMLVRGSSRRITIMRCRPANIRVINRRDSSFGHHRYRVFSEGDPDRRVIDPAGCAGPAVEGGLLAGLDIVTRRTTEDVGTGTNKLT
jgi:hypothetical protein